MLKSIGQRLRRRTVQLAGIVALLIVTVAAFSSSLPTAAQPPAVASFEPFAMSITYWRLYDQGVGQQPFPVTQVLLLEYVNAHDWKLTTLSHSGSSAYAGSWRSFVGQTATSFDAMTKAAASYTVEGGINVPDRWVVAGISSTLPAKGWSKSAASSTETGYELSATSKDAAGVSHVGVESLRFDSIGRPVGYESRYDGKLVASTTYKIQ